MFFSQLPSTYQWGSITIQIRRNRVSKSLRLKIDPILRKPILTVPRYASWKHITDFIRQSETWLHQQLEVLTPSHPPTPKATKALLKAEALSAITLGVLRFSEQLNVIATKIEVKEYRSRWGSCTKEGVLRFSWRLILAPPEILDYVCAHEVAHLVHLNHSSEFWKVVESVYPSYRQARHWLKVHGQQLFQTL